MKMLLVSIFFLLIPHAFSLSFNISSFKTNDDRIKCDADATSVKPSIQLVKNLREIKNLSDSAGRATYHQSMRLWDKATGKLTNFTTHFTFVIDSEGSNNYGDGMAFFLAPVDSKLPDDLEVEGGALGLIIGGNETMFNSIDNPFVAVEFDIYVNQEWDPSTTHVGVDINSIKSNSTVPWFPNVGGGGSNEVSISYNSSTHNLSISFSGFAGIGNNTTVLHHHHHQIVDLTKYLPQQVIFGFSAATGKLSAIHKINSWNFTSDELTDIAPSSSLSPSSSLRPNWRSRNTKIALAVGSGVGGFVLFCGLGLVLLRLCKKKREKEDDHQESDEQMSDDFERGTGPKKYSYAELASATNDFKEEHKLGQGGFGGVYRGFLNDSNSYVAIKRVSKGSKQGRKEFASEVRIISQLRHRNLVQLIGWCHEKKELLLVYEYMPNGSLDFHLFKDQRLLTWSERFKIAQGLASALLYLHEEWEQCVVHRDIKSSNIMLDSTFNAKLGDFGLARLVDHARGAQTTVLAGTMGYMAPECVTTGRTSKESDVYSFGVVALEIACGRKSIKCKAPENEINIANWVWGLYGSGKILEAVDSRLRGDFYHDQIKCLMIVGLWCAHPDHNHRPSIRQAIDVLDFRSPFPSLPSSYPVPTYHELPMRSSFSIISVTNASEVSQNQNISFSSNTNSSCLTAASDNVSPTVSLLYAHKN